MLCANHVRSLSSLYVPRTGKKSMFFMSKFFQLLSLFFFNYLRATSFSRKCVSCVVVLTLYKQQHLHVGVWSKAKMTKEGKKERWIFLMKRIKIYVALKV